MSNPISYKELFDFDGLEESLKSLEQSEKSFATAVSADLNKLSKESDKLKKSLLAIRDQLNGVNITTDSGQKELRNLVTESEKVSKAFKEQNEAVKAGKNLIQANKEEVARLRAEQARLKTEYEQSRVSQQKFREETTRLTLETKKLDLANRQAKQSIQHAARSYNEVNNRAKELLKTIKAAPDGFNSKNKAIQAQITEYKRLNQALKKFDADLGNHQRNVGNYGSALGGVKDQLLQLALGYASIQGALQAVQYTFNTALKTDAIQASLGFTFKSADVAADRLNNLKKIADDLGLEFIGLSDAYRSFAGAAVAANFPMKEMEHIFLAVSNAGAKMKLSNEQINGSLLAIQQMISKGNVQAEELRGQLGERLPGAFSIAARAMGVTEQKLNKMLKDGDVLASDLLPKLANELDKTFGYDKNERINSLQASWNRLKNAFSVGVEEQSNIRDFFKIIIDYATEASNAIIKLLNSSSWKELGYRMAALNVANPIAANVNRELAEVQKNLTSYQRKGDTANLVERFKGKSRDEQVSIIKAQSTARDNASDRFDKTGLASDRKYLQDQVEILKVLNKAYNELWGVKKKTSDIKVIPDDELTSIKEIRDRITELSKLPDSAVKGSEIANRITSLKLRLKELNPTTKEAKQGLAMLEEQLRTLQTQLEIGLLDGTIDASDRKIAVSIQNLENRIDQIKKMRDSLFSPGKQSKDNSNPNDAANVKIDTRKYDRNQDLEGLSNNLIDVERRYAEHHSKLLEDFREHKITKLEFDAHVNELEKSKIYENYFLEKTILAKRLEGVKQGSREYLSIKKQQAQLEESFQHELNNNFFKAEEIKRTILLETTAFVRQSIQGISDIVGPEFSGLFNQLTSDFENFVVNGKLSWEDWAATATATIGAVSTLFLESSQAKVAQLEAEKDHEVKAAGDNAKARERIEADFNKRIAKEKEKQARINRTVALFDIAINTSMGITKAIAESPLTFGLPWSAFMLGAGLAQAAAVLSRPLPKYFKGREDGPGEFAIVNDRGTELLEYQGKYRVAGDGKETVTYLRPGEKVHTHEESKAIFSGENLSRLADTQSLIQGNDRFLKDSYDTVVNYTILSKQASTPLVDYDKLGKVIGDKIKDIPVQETHFDADGVSRYVRTKSARIKELNERNSRTGNG